MTTQRSESPEGAEHDTTADSFEPQAPHVEPFDAASTPADASRHWPHEPAAEAAWSQPAPHAPGLSFGPVPNPVPVPTRESKRRVPRSLVVVAACGLLGGTLLGGAAGAGVAAGMFGTASQQASSVTINGALATDPSTIADVAANASDSVVTVQVTGAQGRGTGSGVVVADGGYIVTNNHVVTLDGAEANASITVQTSDGLLLQATLVGTDPTVDLAVLHVDASLPAISFADSDTVAVGDTAIAIGAPLGLSNTVTDGIVSAVDRGLQIASSSTQQSPGSAQSPFGFWSQDGAQAASQAVSIPVIQTDASINPGNSGGALLNSAGQLIGVNVAIASLGGNTAASGSIGIGFAIESQLVQRVVNEIIDEGQASHGLLGATLDDVNNASVGVVGAQISELTEGGAAAAAGMQVGDVITTIDGIPVYNATDLTAQIRAQAAGATVTLSLVREQQEQEITLTLGSL